MVNLIAPRRRAGIDPGRFHAQRVAAEAAMLLPPRKTPEPLGNNAPAWLTFVSFSASSAVERAADEIAQLLNASQSNAN